ncbi:MAG: DUF1638 domain-containing protein [Pseudomonadota bacterium]
MIPSDQDLTEKGMDASQNGRVLLLACGALAREIIDIQQKNGWTHMDLKCLPAKYHNEPDKITDAVEDAVLKNQASYDQVFVVYADCGTGGSLQAKCAELGVAMVEGPHCYSFFEGNDVFAERSEQEFTAFYLTDFLTRQFDAFMWKPMGLDRHPELLRMYFGHYTKVVYQAQTDDPKLTEIAKEIAARMGLDFERRYTGYGDLTGFVQKAAGQ